MPWRLTNDPYKIWLSEIMLQQTQVKTVIPYYNKWIKKYPTLESVAKSNIDDLLKIWEGWVITVDVEIFTKHQLKFLRTTIAKFLKILINLKNYQVLANIQLALSCQLHLKKFLQSTQTFSGSCQGFLV